MNYLKNNDWYIIDGFETINQFERLLGICEVLFDKTSEFVGLSIGTNHNLRWSYVHTSQFQWLFFKNEEDALCILHS